MPSWLTIMLLACTSTAVLAGCYYLLLRLLCPLRMRHARQRYARWLARRDRQRTRRQIVWRPSTPTLPVGWSRIPELSHPAGFHTARDRPYLSARCDPGGHGPAQIMASRPALPGSRATRPPRRLPPTRSAVRG